MIAHCANPALHPMETRPTPPPMAATITETRGSERRVVLSVGADGNLYGSLDRAIVVLEEGATSLEGDIATAFLGFVRAIKQAKETK